jgi:hypothetical protein
MCRASCARECTRVLQSGRRAPASYPCAVGTGTTPTRRGNCLLSIRARILGRDRLRYRPRIPVRAFAGQYQQRPAPDRRQPDQAQRNAVLRWTRSQVAINVPVACPPPSAGCEHACDFAALGLDLNHTPDTVCLSRLMTAGPLALSSTRSVLTGACWFRWRTISDSARPGVC